VLLKLNMETHSVVTVHRQPDIAHQAHRATEQQQMSSQNAEVAVVLLDRGPRIVLNRSSSGRHRRSFPAERRWSPEEVRAAEVAVVLLDSRNTHRPPVTVPGFASPSEEL
jgi:hypothetical protein